MALVQGGFLGISLFSRSILSVTFGQPLWVVLLCLFGMKPVIVSFTTLHKTNLLRTRSKTTSQLCFYGLCEVITESIPQVIVKTLILFLYPDQRTFLLFVSFLASFLSIGFVLASADKEIDTSKDRRKKEPVLFGYVPKVCGRAQMLASVVSFPLHKLFQIR